MTFVHFETSHSFYIYRFKIKHSFFYFSHFFFSRERSIERLTKKKTKPFVKTAGEISDACDFYTQSIEVFPTAAAYGNLAQCRLKLETYGLALIDSDKALELDPTYIKAYYRKGSAFMALGKFKDALRQFASVVKAKPKSKSAKQKLKQCKKIIQRERFLKAIETEMTKPVSETFDLTSIKVPETYDGPTLESSEEITETFVKQALKWMKNQKFIHRKFVAMILMRTSSVCSRLCVCS